MAMTKARAIQLLTGKKYNKDRKDGLIMLAAKEYGCSHQNISKWPEGQVPEKVELKIRYIVQQRKEKAVREAKKKK